MASLSGIYGNHVSQHIVDLMTRKLIHRGQDEVRKIERDNILMQGGIHSTEKFYLPASSQDIVICDGICPPAVDTQVVSHWPSPFALAAISADDLFIARDPLGVKPLYWGYQNGQMVFASEVKALLQATDDVHEFPPGHFYTSKQGFQSFAAIQTPSEWLSDDVNVIVANLRSKIEKAIQRYLVSDSVGVWLSGGVDSSVIATLLSSQVKKLTSFVIGLPGASDLEYGQQVAQVLGSEHHAFTITLDDVLAALPDTIYALESFDALLVRSSVTHYLISKIAKDYVEIIFTGEGGDELFAGYDYMKQYSVDELPSILEQAIKSLHSTAFQRVDRCATAHGLIPCFPLADMEVVEYALRIPPCYKLYEQDGERIEKWILRRVIEGRIPDSILWRPKTKFWQGTGLRELISQYAEQRISDRDYERERVLPNGWVLASKEELLYYRIFRDYFGSIADLDWMGRTEIPKQRE